MQLLKNDLNDERETDDFENDESERKERVTTYMSKETKRKLKQYQKRYHLPYLSTAACVAIEIMMEKEF